MKINKNKIQLTESLSIRTEAAAVIGKKNE